MSAAKQQLEGRRSVHKRPLDDAELKRIRQRFADGVTLEQLAKLHKRSQSTLRELVRDVVRESGTRRP